MRPVRRALRAQPPVRAPVSSEKLRDDGLSGRHIARHRCCARTCVAVQVLMLRGEDSYNVLVDLGAAALRARLAPVFDRSPQEGG